MKNIERNKLFFTCLFTVVWVLSTIIVVANTWNTPDTGAVINTCAFIALAGSIVGIVRFTKHFMNDQP